MKIDTTFPQAPIAAFSNRPVQNPAEQTSTRPVDRPHHDEAADNRQPPQTAPAEAREPAVASSHDSDDAAGRHTASRPGDSPSTQQQELSHKATEPSRVGELLDVLA